MNVVEFIGVFILTASIGVLVLMFLPWIKYQLFLIKLWFLGFKLKKSENPTVRRIGKVIMLYVKKEIQK